MGRSCEGRVALVTGASRGIGKAIALRLAAEGAAVAICARPRAGMQEHSLEVARAEFEGAGADVLAIPFDLGDSSKDRADLVHEVEAELGPIDILVNNAAAGGFHPFLEWTDRAIDQVLELNFWAPWHLVRAVLPGMRERQRGWIVNVSSATAELPVGPPFPDTHPSRRGTIYGGTKAFMNRWTVSLASEVEQDGIAVNTLAPQAAAATEVLVQYSNLADYLYEPLDTMAEAALALCTADVATLTGKITYSLQLLVDLDRAVYDLAGAHLVDGWQPDAMPPRIAKMAQHIRGEISGPPSNVDALPVPRS